MVEVLLHAIDGPSYAGVIPGILLGSGAAVEAIVGNKGKVGTRSAWATIHSQNVRDTVGSSTTVTVELCTVADSGGHGQSEGGEGVPARLLQERRKLPVWTIVSQVQATGVVTPQPSGARVLVRTGRTITASTYEATSGPYGETSEKICRVYR